MFTLNVILWLDSLKVSYFATVTYIPSSLAYSQLLILIDLTYTHWQLSMLGYFVLPAVNRDDLCSCNPCPQAGQICYDRTSPFSRECLGQPGPYGSQYSLTFSQDSAGGSTYKVCVHWPIHLWSRSFVEEVYFLCFHIDIVYVHSLFFFYFGTCRLKLGIL